MDTSTTSTLVLTNLTESYFNQSYTCMASNEHGISNSSAVLTQGSELVVQCLHVFTICDRICKEGLIHASDFATLMSYNFVCD